MVRKLAGAGRRCLGKVGAAIAGGTAIAALAFTVATLVPMSTAVADGCCGGGAKPEGGDSCGDGAEGGHSGHGGSAEGGAVDGEAAGHASGLLVDLGNTKCPIMGGKPDGKTWSEWNGLRIGHCCPGCIATFKADPEKALTAKGIEWKPAAEAVAKANQAEGEARTKALEALGKKWKVVRDGTASPPPGLLVDLGNTRCPIMGGKPDGKTWSEWNGLRVGHCCPGCIAKFKADPAKALDAKGIEWKAAALAVAEVNKAQGEARAKALAALKKTHKVLREPAPEPAPAK